MSFEEVQKVEMEIFELTQKLNGLRKNTEAKEVTNYNFRTLEGVTTLKDLFAGKDKLLVIHNMGQGCRYCTLWADGINPFIEHLESTMAVVLVSKDAPETQRRLANSRGWRMRMASHEGGAYMIEQACTDDGKGNLPGAAFYELKGDQIFLKNKTIFGPYDQFCSFWNFLSLGGLKESDWTPQFDYWQRPEKMDDGGKNLNC